MITGNALSMHTMSTITPKDAHFTSLGLHHLEGQNQTTYFNLLNAKDTKNPEFVRLTKIARNNKDPHTRKLVAQQETRSFRPQTKTNNTSGKKAARILNFTLKLKAQEHETFKNYFNAQRINGPEYKKLLIGKSNNPKIQQLLNQATSNHNPQISKIIPQQTNPARRPQLSWEQVAELKQQYAQQEKTLRKITIRSDVKQRSPKKSPDKRRRLFLSM